MSDKERGRASGDLPSKEEWISRCEQQYMARGCDRPYAIHAAEACWELIEGDLTESPEELADEDLSCG